ncbi:hypothetical protein AEGHOMDF_4094 [Methylobacterium soli]|uniref:hypothetical protein n=1 Tax=Methylobacterium soli TaxID=553447 RepID=UPI001EE1B909|nr:hypothetical protein [Methylobacterium soli]GJE44902.1 hypothetical protein AEGHOMDF_4094 [Methylobacterium soli]
MMPIAIDPSETRTETKPGKAPIGRLVLLGGLGMLGIVGLSVTANALLSGLAGPPPMPVSLSRSAANWPELKDGVPDLVNRGPAKPIALPAADSAPLAKVASADPDVPLVMTPATDSALRPSLAPASDMPAAKGPDPKIPEASIPEGKASDTKNSTAKSPAAAPAAAKVSAVPAPPRRPPMIENAAVIGPSREAPVLAPTKTAVAVAPLRTETVRARSADSAFAALPPTKAAAEPAKPAKAAAAKAKSDPKPKPAVAQAAPAQAVAEAEPETTEVFGLKLPSLAPAGRKIRESVEALGDAVRGIPEKF